MAEANRGSDADPIRWRLVGAITLAALILRLPGHLNSGLWFDEIWLLVETVRLPFGELYTTFESDNNHPLYGVAAWVSVRLFGESAWALRLPAVLFGAASIGMLWVLASAVVDRTQAALVTLLMTLSYHHVWFSQNARGYSMLLFWTLAAAYLLIRQFRDPQSRAWLGYAVCLAFATYTHSSAVLAAVGFGVVSAVDWLRNRAKPGAWRPTAGLVLAGLISVALHAAILGQMIDFFTSAPGVEQVAPSPEGAAGEQSAAAQPVAPESEWNSLWWTVRAVVESLGVGLVPGLVGLIGAGLTMAVGTWTLARRDWRVAALFLLPAVIGVGVTMAMGRPVRPRFLFNLGGFFLVIGVAGMWSLATVVARNGPTATARLRTGAAVAMVGAFLWVLPRAYTLPKQDFEGALAQARALEGGGARVAITGLTILPYRDYYREDFAVVESASDLDRLLPADGPMYVLHTIPIYLESTAPALAARLAAAEEVGRHRGSLGAGDVVLLRVHR